jgi:hypothetical protein
LFPNASAKSVAAFEMFVSVACCSLGLLMSPSVHQYTIGNSRLVLNGRKDTTRVPVPPIVATDWGREAAIHQQSKEYQKCVVGPL